MRFYHFYASFLTLITICFSAHAQSVQSDFDQDGMSDFTIVQIQQNGDLDWTSNNPFSSAYVAHGILGVSGNHTVHANWFGNGIPDIGVVTVDDANQIVWSVKDSSDTLFQRTFGVNDDLVLSGADFNGDGVADAVAARVVKRKVQWDFALDMFTNTSSSLLTQQLTYGSDIDKIFFANIDGKNDWIGIIVKSSKGKITVRFRNLLTGQVKIVSRFPASIAPLSRPFPLRQAEGNDLLGFSLKGAGSTRFAFFTTAGKRIARTSLPGTGDVIIGNFTNDPGEEIALKSTGSSNFTVYNPITNVTITIPSMAGIPVDAINVHKMVVNTNSPSPTVPNVPPADPHLPGVGTIISCTTVTDINSLPDILYKNENVHGGRGRSWLDQGHHLGGVRKLVVAGLNGVVFGCFGLYRCDNPYGCRYYQAMCGDPLDNSAFIAKAKLNGAGSPYAYVSNGKSGACYRFKADATRYGSVRK
jgi:hypothetical protein